MNELEQRIEGIGVFKKSQDLGKQGRKPKKGLLTNCRVRGDRNTNLVGRQLRFDFR